MDGPFDLALLDAVPDAVLVAGPDGLVRHANTAATRLLGYPDIVGVPVKAMLPDLPGTAVRRDGTAVSVEVTVTEQADRTVLVLRENADRRLAAAVRAVPYAIIMKTLDGVVTDWNPAATRAYGYGPDEVLGRHVGFLVPPHRRAEESAAIAVVARGERIDRYRTERVRKDGTVVTVALTMSPLVAADGRVTGIASTSRVVNAEELAEAKGFGLLEAAPDAIVAVDAGGHVVLANAQAERMLGYNRSDLFGRRIETLVPVALDEMSARQVAARRRDGGEFPADVNLSSLDTDDGRIVVVAVRDATERLAAQAERDRLAALAEEERLARRMQQVQRLESLGQLAGGVAHDFNNLLGVIVNYAAFVGEEVVEAASADPARWGPVATDVEQIQRAAERGVALTHQLLAFGRREVARPRALSVNDVVTGTLAMLGRSLGEHVSLRTSLADDAWTVEADPNQLEQVLVNLAVNARDAMPGGGTITIRTANCSEAPGALPEGRYVRVEVADTGSGMPPDVVARAFEPFFTTKAKGSGTGLGLATVYGVVNEIGGDVVIASTPGEGTCFSIFLPASLADAPVAVVPSVAGSRPGGRETVLVCEDEPAMGEVTRRILARAGYSVLLAADGADAIRLAGSFDGPVDLLLTDVVMPQVLGREVADSVRRARPEARVLYMSGHARPVLAGTLEPGVALVEKPFSEDVLLGAVRAVLDQ